MRTFGPKAVDQELKLADKAEERLNDDKKDPYQRDISEYNPTWKEEQAELEELLMRAKVQFINGDLTGATETYRVIETRFSENFEAKEMLRRISIMKEESYLGYLKHAKKCLKKSKGNGTPKSFRAEVEEVQEVQEGPNKLEEKLSIIQIPEYNFSPLHSKKLPLNSCALPSNLTLPRETPPKKVLTSLYWVKKTAGNHYSQCDDNPKHDPIHYGIHRLDI